ncbi:MAG: serine/threonine-protein kinase [Opitutaceae bacterium]|nr:serine/threonine-protein kinase [Opitutaceae bacterium]
MNRTGPRDEQLFGDAIGRPPAERRPFLDRACDGDAELRGRLEVLLAAHEGPESLLDSAVMTGLAELAGEVPGGMIGHYKLLQKIGEGGCGVVWMAEQEAPVRRRVALKVIKAGMDTREVIARFSAERQALAMMDHPGIAKVLDAGATENGRPYFAMELVRGVPITRFADEQNLGIRARLELFTRVCEAVQHAHQKGIIHRDLKPSNILVELQESEPVPTVIDFGIAKAIQGRLTDATLFTSYEQIIGTPAYMSPEQADTAGLDIDTRSDVYSLGVVLYELLAGRCPFDPDSLATPNREEMRRLIREVEPPRPSTRFRTLSGEDRETVARRRGIPSTRLPVLLAADLDWIVMKALEKNRARRYESPMALADDLGRHLRHEPVLARPPGGLYRLRKFVRRHRVGVGTAAVMAGTLIAATAISVDQAVRARQAERVATEALSRVADERARADDLLTFMFEELKGPLARIGQLNVLDRVIEKALAYFGSLDPKELDDRALVKHVTALNKLGLLRIDQGRFADAERAFRESHRRALLAVARNPRDPAALWARCESEWGNGFLHYRQNQIQPAREWFMREGASRAALAALEPNNLRWQRELQKQQHNLAAMETDHGDPERARASFRDEYATLVKLQAALPNDLELQNSISTVASFLGSLAEAAGEFPEAEKWFAEQTARVEANVRADPLNTHWQYKVGDSLLRQARIRALTGRRDEAAAYVARSRALMAPLVENDPTHQRWRRTLAMSELIQVQLAQAAGEHRRGAERAVPMRRELEWLAEKEPADASMQSRLALALRLEAELQHAAGAPEAGATVARAIAVGEKLVGRKEVSRYDRAERAAAGVIAGRIAMAAGNTSGANAHWQHAQTVLGPIDPKCRDWRILDLAARLARLLGRNQDAAAIISQLTAIGFVPFEPWPEPIPAVSAQ